MTEIQPDRWYTLYGAFGDSLFVLDRFWMKEEDGLTRLSVGVIQDSELSESATFKGGKFLPSFDWESLALEDLTKTAYGNPIYFPVDKPTIAELTGVQVSPTNIEGRTKQYAQLAFMIDPVLEEDLIGESFIFQNPSKIYHNNKGIKSRQYGYQLLLKSENGIFVSDVPAVYGEDDSIPFIVFDRWRPINSEKIGEVYVPLRYKDTGPLEIMLQGKK